MSAGSVACTRRMPNWLKGMVAPTLMLWACMMASGLACLLPLEGAAAGGAYAVSAYLQPFAIAFWVMADARKRGRQLFYDYDTFVFFIWPILVPVYLVQTRGARAVFTLLCFAGIWMVAMVPFLMVSLMGGFGE